MGLKNRTMPSYNEKHAPGLVLPDYVNVSFDIHTGDLSISLTQWLDEEKHVSTSLYFLMLTSFFSS